ncbi:hypothetical protein [Bacteroides heparinolyticus]|uniref:hypothetical protein n=1 Tax=Prevotella heparinolytica TaxID=28113 RepID=UPI0035A08F08
MKIKNAFIVLLITAALSLAGQMVKQRSFTLLESLPGMLILVAISIVGIAMAKYIPLKIPAVAYIVTLAVVVTIPGFPGAETISAYTAKVDFLALTTPILAYAGIYTGKNLDTLKKSGWKIIIVALFVIIGTYVGSALIAEIVLRLTGQI